ncbi:hypothetical protein [Petropleomorpha daqingensis]|uniref:Uncharacterized protein n=1 Tax=Petropleomorpha daqingensis TaxID=2026353 RepID=A0A853CDL3_9ACTN|nr:hypothetical protein [Petropleomorpha daqingensis]NYJ05487.1 hypothetical protein [Petropleomorpha daqingensis]
MPPRPRTAAPSAPPPRPRVTSDLPLPGLRSATPRTPWPVRAGAVLWTFAVGAGVVAVATSAIDSTGLRDELYLSARAAAPKRTAAVLHDSVTVTIAAAAVFTGVVLLGVLIGTVLLNRRRRAALWVLPVAGVLALAAAVLDQNLVAGGATDLDRWSFLVFGACVLAGLVLLPVRASRAWLRRH